MRNNQILFRIFILNKIAYLIIGVIVCYLHKTNLQEKTNFYLKYLV